MPLLSTDNITKRFPGVTALRDVRLSLESGDIHCLVGENGAGKSTLIKILSGAIQPDEGTILLDGAEVKFSSPYAALHAGVATIFQDSNLVPELDVAENILLGREPRRKGFPLLDRPAMRKLAETAMELVGERIDPARKAQDLTPSQHQMVEIARALSRSARVVILDEPTAALTERESQTLFSAIRRLASQGVAFIYISHRLEEIFRIGSHITVLRDGSVVGSTIPGETSRDELVRMMVGRNIAPHISPLTSHVSPLTQDPLLTVSSLSSRFVHDCSFTLHTGEILGIAGLAGSGRTELARCLFGADQRVSGTTELAGRVIDIRQPSDALARGIALLTEDRNRLGLFGQRSILENITISRLKEFTRLVRLDSKREAGEAASLAGRFNVKHAGLSYEVETLSGGNRQKVLLARSVGLKPRVIIFDEPTAGIDVGAKSEIHSLIRNLADRGTGVIVISSELPELLALCSRIMVMRNRTIAGTLHRSEATEESLLHMATGSA